MANNALRLPDWDILSIEESDDVTTITARYLPMPDACPKCGVVGRLYRHGTAPVDYNDLPYGKRTLIHTEVQRFRCRDCLETSMQPLPHMDERHRFTARCIAHVERQGVRRTFRDISRDFDVNEKTIRSICTPYLLAEVAKHRIVTPRFLGVDELGLAGQGRGIFVNLATGRPLDIIRTCQKPDMGAWIAQLDDSKIRIVTMDMTKQYRDVVRDRFPQAVIIMDKFHVVRYADDAFKGVRAKARSKAAGGDGKNPRGPLALLRKHADRLNPMQEMLVDGISKNSPLVGAGYRAKKGFYAIWKAKDRKEAEQLFAEWSAGVEPEVRRWFGPVARMIERWRTEVFSYFDYPATNAMTENRNNLVKELNRAGRGYSFEIIRAKALLALPLSKWRKCVMCHGEYPESAFRSASEVVRGKSERVRKQREAFGRFDGQYCINCHHLIHSHNWEIEDGDPKARMKWELGVETIEEFNALTDEQILDGMRQRRERGFHNPYEDY